MQPLTLTTALCHDRGQAKKQQQQQQLPSQLPGPELAQMHFFYYSAALCSWRSREGAGEIVTMIPCTQHGGLERLEGSAPAIHTCRVQNSNPQGST